MSAQVQAVGALCLLLVVALAVVLWMFWPTPRRVQEAQDEARRKRQQQAAEIVAASQVAPCRSDRTGADVAANWHSGEQPEVPVPGDTAQAWVVERPAGDTQEWEIQERVAPVEVVDEQPEPEVPYWQRPALANEPTPLADAIGPIPAMERLESFTQGWLRLDRVQAMRDIREQELELAKAEPADEEMADEEMAA